MISKDLTILELSYFFSSTKNPRFSNINKKKQILILLNNIRDHQADSPWILI